MNAGNYPLVIDQGSTFKKKFTLYTDTSRLTAVNLTGATITAQIVVTKGAAAIATFSVVDTDLANGIFYLNLTDDVTAALTDLAGFWDLHILFSDAITTTKYLAGTYTLELQT